MPTAIKVKDEKITNIKMVRFDTSTSPSWKVIKVFIKYSFFKPYHNCKKFFATDYNCRRITTPNTTRYKTNNFKPFEEK